MNNERISLRKDVPCVYFISDGQSHCKIGVTSDIRSRFVTIQVGNPFDLILKDVIYFDTIDEAYEKERELHAVVSAHNIRGEWFDESAVDAYFSGEKEESESYMCDECPEFSILDAAKLFMICLESKSVAEFSERYEAEMPEYWKQYDLEKSQKEAKA